MNRNFEYHISRMMQQLKNWVRIQPLNLGGSSGSAGGIGTPPGGIIGQLPQTKVAYDTSEISSSGIPASGQSLLDNLNHIRYRITVLEENPPGGTISVSHDDVLVASGIEVLNFEGSVDVTDAGGGTVNINITGGVSVSGLDASSIVFVNSDGTALDTDTQLKVVYGYSDPQSLNVIIGGSTSSTTNNYALNVINNPDDGGNYGLGQSLMGFGSESSLDFYYAIGTQASPTYVTAGENLGNISWYGRRTAAWRNVAGIYAYSLNDYVTANAQYGTSIIFWTTPEDEATAITALDLRAREAYFTGDVLLPLTGEYYFGDYTTNGSWRFTATASGIEQQNLIGGVWTTIPYSGTGGGGITSVVAGDDISVDNSSPSAPVVSLQEDIDVRSVQFDITCSGIPEEGQVCWNTDDGTLNIGMPGGNVVLQVGQEQLVRVVNKTGALIENGSAVYVNGQHGQRPTIAKAIATNNVIANCTIGLATEDIENDANGYICTQGLVRGVNTLSYTAGNILYLSSTTAGSFQEAAPASPNTVVGCGIVLSSNATEGIIAVRVKVLSVRAERAILTDTGDYFTSTDVEGALQEIGYDLQNIVASGSGDMLKSVYDTDDDGIVDNSSLLEGHPASDFITADGLTPFTDDYWNMGLSTLIELGRAHFWATSPLPPFYVQSSVLIENLNADKLDGIHASGFAVANHTHDDRYYTETELQTSGSAQVHWGNITNIPSGVNTRMVGLLTNGNSDAPELIFAGGDIVAIWESI